MAQYLVQMADMGFGLTREDVMRTAFLIVDKSGREHPFSNGMLEENGSRDLEHVTRNSHSALLSPYHTVGHLVPTQKSFKTFSPNLEQYVLG